MNLTDLKTLLDLAATYPYAVKDEEGKFEVNFYDEFDDDEPCRTITIYKKGE